MTNRACLRLKDDRIRLSGLQPAGLRILAALDRLARSFNTDVELTSVVRSDSGGHGRGEAVDVSVRAFSDVEIASAWHWLRRELGDDFTVLYEVPTAPAGEILAPIAYVSKSATGPHFHIQLKKGFGPWPPVEATGDRV